MVMTKDISDKTEETKSKYPLLVKNIHSNAIHLRSGLLKPGEEGLASIEECSNLLYQYLEIV